MARTETIFTIFLASPGDVVEERNRLEDAVFDWNRTWARDQGIRLELLRWESDAFPGIGLDAQDVINQQIPDDYDLFIGIMWSRFGTPTLRAGSGTLEEFERALARRSGGSENPEIFFYFKDAPVPPSKIDGDQLKAVQDFKERLGEHGVLRWDFIEAEQFEKLITLHVTRFVQSKRQQGGSVVVCHSDDIATAVISASETSRSERVDDCSVDDVGYLDQLEEFEEKIYVVSAISQRLTQAQNSLTHHMEKCTAELEGIKVNPSRDGLVRARAVISSVAAEMLRFTEVVNGEVPQFRNAMSASMVALTNAATLSVEFDRAEAKGAKASVVSLLDALVGARLSTASFRENTLALPRITKELNVAKRQQAAALQSLIAEFENAEQLLVESIALLDAL